MSGQTMSQSDSESVDAVLVNSRDIRDYNEDNILPLPADELDQVTKWLRPTPYDLEGSEYSRHLASYLDGTGNWLRSTKTYQQWHQGSEHGLLWVKGMPGSGKSVMAASIIHQLRKEEVPVLYFFFRQIVDANHQPVSVLRDWLCQLLPFSPPLQAKLKEDYVEEARPIDSLAMSDLWMILKSALLSFTRVYCVTDALDEMDQGNEDFLHSLAELGTSRPANTKVLITSRPVASVELPLRQYNVPYIELDERLVDIDIAVYVQYRLQNSSIPLKYWNLVTSAVPGRANGLFLYAKLSMDAFVKPGADPEAPANLNVLYENLLREHARRSNISDELQLLILQSATHATRPLRLLEVAEMAKATYTPFENVTLKEIKKIVRLACGPLLQILRDETVSVVHHSLTEFLKGVTRRETVTDSTYPILEAGPTNKRLALACMDYINENCRLERLQASGVGLQFVRLQLPFLEYAAGNWHIHARRAALAGEDMSSFYVILDEFFTDDERFMAWLTIDWPENHITGLTALHAAAGVGLSQYAKHLLQEGADPNAKSDHNDPPLYWAALNGHADVAQVLIENGADPDGEANEGYKPLHQAAKRNHADVIKVLLAAGVNPLTGKTKEYPGRWCGNAPTSIGCTPLMYACQNGHVEAVAEFLPYIKDPETSLRALWWSAGGGHSKCVTLILQHLDVDINGVYYGKTPLFMACHTCDVKTIDELLKRGADPNILCSDIDDDEFSGLPLDISFRTNEKTENPIKRRGYTALHALVGYQGSFTRTRLELRRQSLHECIQLLIAAGVHLELKCPRGLTALHYGCKFNIIAVKVLLDAGADPTTESDEGHTILHYDGSTDDELLPILLESDVVHIKELMKRGKETPLHTRLRGHRQKSILEFLRLFKPDVNAADSAGNRPLHLLLSLCSVDADGRVLDALLAAGADINMQNAKGETALHRMKDSTGIELVSKLIDSGADIEIRDLDGQTALFKNAGVFSGRFLCNTTTYLFDVLVELGARLDTRDNKGRTLLHQVVEIPKRLDYLVANMKFDPPVVDNKGNTLFHEATSKKRQGKKLPVFIHLRKLGVDIDQPNYHGKTVLHKMCSMQPDAIYRYPSEKSVFDYVLQECKNLNPRDIDGVEPIHIAAAISEDWMFKLLEAGADPLGVTNEGMTVLHIAARARQPGTISLVLSHLTGLNSDALEAFVNRKNTDENTALHYACCAGHPESVNLLLDAGADPNLPGKDGHTPIRAAADFEVEQERWRKVLQTAPAGTRLSHRSGVFKGASIFLKDSDLPDTDLPDTAHVTESLGWRIHVPQSQLLLVQESYSARLEEILTSLIVRGSDKPYTERILRDTFRLAVSKKRDYTAECLLHLQSRFYPDMNLFFGSDSEDLMAFRTRRMDERSLLKSEEDRYITQETQQDSPFETRKIRTVNKLLALHHYDLLEELSTQTGAIELCWIPYPESKFLVSYLACLGLSNLLKRICNRETARRFDDHEWRVQVEKINRLRPDQSETPLATACSRRIPNMEVVRFLVEEICVDIGTSSKGENHDSKERASSQSVLHYLALGNFWWHVHEALPYLIHKGADLEARNEKGQTPLHMAVDQQHRKGAFFRNAAHVLLKNGADANAVDHDGKSCLSMAGSDVELVTRLLSYGAQVSPVAILSAIKTLNVNLLESYLAQGELANLRPHVTRVAGKIPNYEHSKVVDSEMYPLYYAAFYSYRSETGQDEDLRLTRIRIIETLLRHGADPYATFVKLHRVYDKKSNKYICPKPGYEGQWRSETCTIIHEILQEGLEVNPFFDLPCLRLEQRDTKGQTLLLAASRGHVERIEHLLLRGAKATVQDHQGRTALHNLIEHQPQEAVFKSITSLCDKEPELVHVADVLGHTPLHYVLKRRPIQLEYVDLLLKHGAYPLEPDAEGNTAIHYFARNPYRYESRIEQFRDLGGDINAQNRAGDSPLFEYIAHMPLKPFPSSSWDFDKKFWEVDDEHYLRYFKNSGANFFVRNHTGSSLLHATAGRRLVQDNSGLVDEEDLRTASETVLKWFKFLTDLGLDPMLEDNQQRTCSDVAAACGNEHILKLFQRKPLPE